MPEIKLPADLRPGNGGDKPTAPTGGPTVTTPEGPATEPTPVDVPAGAPQPARSPNPPAPDTGAPVTQPLPNAPGAPSPMPADAPNTLQPPAAPPYQPQNDLLGNDDGPPLSAVEPQKVPPRAKAKAPQKIDHTTQAVIDARDGGDAGAGELFIVRLQDRFNTVPPAVVRAVDRYDAVEGYKAWAGINATPHPVTADPMPPDADVPQSVPAPRRPVVREQPQPAGPPVPPAQTQPPFYPPEARD